MLEEKEGNIKRMYIFLDLTLVSMFGARSRPQHIDSLIASATINFRFAFIDMLCTSWSKSLKTPRAIEAYLSCGVLMVIPVGCIRLIPFSQFNI